MGRGRTVAALLALAAGLGLGGCSGPPPPARPARAQGAGGTAATARACPPSVPPTATYAGRRGTAALADARRVHLCAYSAGGEPTKDRPAAGVVLSGSAAAAVARIVAGGAPAPGGAQRCAGRPPQLLLRFETPAGVADVPVVWWRCPDVALVGGRLRALPHDVATTLIALGGAYSLKGGGRPAPDVAGLAVGEAVRRAAAARLRIEVAGEAVDASVPAGTVLVQNPPAGAAGIGRGIDVLLAEPPARPCRTRALSLIYRGGGAGAGNDFGAVVLRDHSSRACRLAGPVRLTGVDDDGAAVTRTVRYDVEPDLVLTPHGRPLRPAHGPEPGEFVGLLQLAAEYRDGSGPGGRCDQPVVPHAWRLTMPDGAVAVVANAGSGGGYPGLGALRTCAGELNEPVPIRHM